MHIIQSDKTSDTTFLTPEEIETINYLKHVVESIAIPRHYEHEYQNNKTVRDWIKLEFENLGLQCSFQGSYDNVIARYGNAFSKFSIILGAHYDGAPGSPGADDNASAIAGVLGVARALKCHQEIPIVFVAFNREEDDMMGSREFVNSLTPQMHKSIKCAHILEMIGYASDQKGTQYLPAELPIKVSDVGNFIGIIANKNSNSLIDNIIKIADTHIPTLPVTALKVFFGAENTFPNLLRSDHTPFWEKKLPALMWTDTSEFRNPNYHKKSDTPDTLNYTFMCKVVELIKRSILEQVAPNR